MVNQGKNDSAAAGGLAVVMGISAVSLLLRWALEVVSGVLAVWVGLEDLTIFCLS